MCAKVSMDGDTAGEPANRGQKSRNCCCNMQPRGGGIYPLFRSSEPFPQMHFQNMKFQISFLDRAFKNKNIIRPNEWAHELLYKLLWKRFGPPSSKQCFACYFKLRNGDAFHSTAEKGDWRSVPFTFTCTPRKAPHPKFLTWNHTRAPGN